MTRSEGDRVAEMVLLVVREVKRRRVAAGVHRGVESTRIYVPADVADIVYGRGN